MELVEIHLVNFACNTDAEIKKVFYLKPLPTKCYMVLYFFMKNIYFCE